MFRLIHPPSLLFLLCLYLAGCAALSAQPDPSRFFTLTPLPQAEEAVSKISAGSEQISLGIGPVKLPGYLDRQELVTRISQNRFDVSENDRWALVCCYNARRNSPYKEGKHPSYTPLERVNADTIRSVKWPAAK